LAVDLLNPNPATEAKKHKLKVRPKDESKDNVSEDYVTEDYVAENYVSASYLLVMIDSRPRPAILLHGRQVPGMLHDHDRLLPCPNRGDLPGLHNGPVPTDRWPSTVNRGLLVPEKVRRPV